VEKFVDARGLSCPSPVVMTKQALDSLADGTVTAVVDDRTALENIVRLARSLAYGVEVEEQAGEYYIHIEKGKMGPAASLTQIEQTVLLVTSSVLGKGSEELGQTLLKNFFYTLTQIEGAVNTVILMNSGVFLAVEGSEVLEYLTALEHSGVEVLSCGTCLDYYRVKDKLMAGKVTNMYSALEILAAAPKVITL